MLPAVNEMWNSFNDNLTADLFHIPTLRQHVTSALLAQYVDSRAGWLHCKHYPRTTTKQSSILRYNHGVI